MPSPRPAPQDRRSGFALLITITLVAFLVLILVSLAAFTRVETQVASNNQQHLQARQNALMALNVALGQLQLTLGPDQRVSAPASQKGDGVRNYGAQDLDNNGNWVGVYRQNPNPAVTARDPQLLNWLVSGNQNLSIPASTANTPPVQPGATVAGLAKTMSALTPVSVGDRDAILLVGPGSTMAESAATAPDSVVDNFVVAPLEDIQVPAGSLPGFSPGSTTLTTIGRFAYWVGDENIKAKVSLADPGASPTATSDQQSYRLKVAQRSGIELVESADGTPLSTNYPANAEELMKVLDLKQLPMSDTGGGQSALNEAAKNRFHDLTATSYSLLSDTARGGLKKDLTTWLANSTGLPATAPADDDFITPPHSTDTTGYGLPRWGLVRSYAGIASGVARAPQQQTATQHGFHPIITYFRMGLSASCDEDTPANPTPRLRIHVFPVVVLWNPHDTPIAPAQYEVAYGSRFNTSTSVFIRSAAGDGADPGWQVPANINKGSIRMTTATMNDTTPSAVTNGPQDARRYFRFLVDCTEPIPPGESRVFTLDSSGLYTAGTPGNLPNRMSAHTDYRKDNSAYFEHPALTMTASDIWVDAVARTERKKFYVITNGGEREFGLFPVNAPGANPTVAEMMATNPYHLVQHLGIGEVFRRITPVNTDEMDDSYICTYFYGQMQMSAGHTYFRTPRWLAQDNPRAPRFHLAPMASQTFTGAAANGMPGANNFDENRASAGESIFAPPVTVAPIAGFQPAGAATEPWKHFFSLAQLQHVNVSILSQNPAYAIGNSEADYHIYHSDGSVGLADTSITAIPFAAGATVVYSPANQLLRLYDLSYLLNRDIWDRYFFSTIPSPPPGPDVLTGDRVADAAYRLPNARHVFAPDAIASSTAVAAELGSPAAFDTAAARLLVNGGFNVNSASVDAWRALLASLKNVDTAPGGLSHPYARFPNTEAASTPANQSWTSGYRILSDAQIDTLARRLVAEVRTRGPFLSLADFVNRRLLSDATGYKGPIQAAIDATDADTNAANRINDRLPFNDYAVNATGRVIQTYGSNNTQPAQPAAFQQLLRGGATTASTPSASRAAYAPGFLSQADVLQALGPVLSARSDTFVIRAYGDVRNPTTDLVEGRAWCEAVVQRLPDYVDSTLAAWETPAPGSDNERFGRRFKVTSFRWLSPSDI